MPSASTHTTTSRPALIDLPAVAERLGVNERHIRRLVAERRIPFVKWGHLLRFDPPNSMPGSTRPACRLVDPEPVRGLR